MSGLNFDIPLKNAAELLPRRNGRPVTYNTLRTWVTVGCYGICLVAKKVGRFWYTSREAIEEFQAACTHRSNVQFIRMPSEVTAEVRRAREELAKLGFYGSGNKKKHAKGQAGRGGKQGKVPALR